MDILFAVNRLPALIFGATADDDDFSDRLNYRYTVAILSMFSAIVSNRQFSGRQIQCWVPAYFTDGYEEYTNHICYISNTYYIEPDQPLPKDQDVRHVQELKYYQWIPFILLFLAGLFYIPRLFWKTFMTRSGIDIKDVVEAAISYKQLDKIAKKSTIMTYIVTMIDQYVDDPRRRQGARFLSPARRIMAFACCMPGKFHGSYFIGVYLITKMLFLVNTLAQFYLLKGFLGITFEDYGIEILLRFITRQKEFDSSIYFPKVTLCDFGVREVNHPNHSQPYTVQCVLPINLFNQQVFMY
ncbi:hypothetical protein ACOME3_006788 [Neoechinorhynchus agilis]